LKIYHRDRAYTYVFDFPDDKSTHGDFILEQLRTTDYGRCVYKMDNDQPDHFVSSMEFEDGVTANFSMEAFTSYHGRRTRFMGSRGDITGDMTEFVHTDFLTNKVTKWDISVEDVDNYKNSGHGGGDWALVTDWIQAVNQQNPDLLTSSIDASIESHIMGFMAEKSRLSNKTMSVEL
jgi:predicted dehydrogenase